MKCFGQFSQGLERSIIEGDRRIHHFGSDVHDVINIDAQPSCLAIKQNQGGTRITNLQVNHRLHHCPLLNSADAHLLGQHICPCHRPSYHPCPLRCIIPRTFPVISHNGVISNSYLFICLFCVSINFFLIGSYSIRPWCYKVKLRRLHYCNFIIWCIITKYILLCKHKIIFSLYFVICFVEIKRDNSCMLEV